MNYLHAFHAGNFADVVKHAVLVRILLHLAQKPTPFRVIDTHAGAGLYDLHSAEAARTEEWRAGVSRLSLIDPASDAGRLLAPYRALIPLCDGVPTHYPGSPRIAQALMRSQDRAVFCETQAPVRQQLEAALGRDRRLKVLDLDGWTALRAFVPPPERRGLVLVDPPFEAPDDHDRLAAAFLTAFGKWRTGVYVLWYPIKALASREGFVARVRESGARATSVEFAVGTTTRDGRLQRAGLIIANAPYTLADDLRVILQALAIALQTTDECSWTVDDV